MVSEVLRSHSEAARGPLLGEKNTRERQAKAVGPRGIEASTKKLTLHHVAEPILASGERDCALLVHYSARLEVEDQCVSHRDSECVDVDLCQKGMSVASLGDSSTSDSQAPFQPTDERYGQLTVVHWIAFATSSNLPMLPMQSRFSNGKLGRATASVVRPETVVKSESKVEWCISD